MTSEKIPHKKLLFFPSRFFQNVWLLCTLVTGISQNVVGFWNKLHRYFFLYIKNIPFLIMQEKNQIKSLVFLLHPLKKKLHWYFNMKSGLFAFIIHSKTKLAANRILSSKVSVYKISTTIELVQWTNINSLMNPL